MSNKISQLKELIGNPEGKCYIASEAAQHLLGKDKWKPCVLRHEGGTHWYLQHRKTGEILDLTSSQFKTLPDYSLGRGCGFLTKNPSKKTQILLKHLKDKL